MYHRKNNDKILVIGMYIDQLERIARELDAPLLKGQTANRKREDMYQKFRNGSLDLLVLSKVGNFAIDLPDANVAIQVSGTFGSRQEEAQRFGRILRPKKDHGAAHFYSIIFFYGQEKKVDPFNIISFIFTAFRATSTASRPSIRIIASFPVPPLS